MFYTTVLTFDNKTIIIPNGQLSNNVVTNLSREGKRRLDIDIRFRYTADIEQIKKVLEASLKLSQNILTNHQPALGYQNLILIFL